MSDVDFLVETSPASKKRHSVPAPIMGDESWRAAGNGWATPQKVANTHMFLFIYTHRNNHMCIFTAISTFKQPSFGFQTEGMCSHATILNLCKNNIYIYIYIHIYIYIISFAVLGGYAV